MNLNTPTTFQSAQRPEVFKLPEPDRTPIIFSPGAIINLGSIPVADFSHRYEPERFDRHAQPLEIAKVREILTSVKEEIFALHKARTGRAFDSYSASTEETDAVRNEFYKHRWFGIALELLEINHWHAPAIRIPWWNEIAASEKSFLSDAKRPEVVLQPRHSYETQLVRVGEPMPIQSVSVAGVVLTAPDAAGQREIMLGVRGGKSYANTVHTFAGALQLPTALMTGEETIYDTFVRTELIPETGLTAEYISAANFCMRIFDRVNEKGPTYVFKVESRLSRAELYELWNRNKDVDRAEHKEMLFIPNEPSAIRRFIGQSYRGVLADRDDRGDNERYLLHPGALILAGLAGMKPEELRSYYQTGTW